MKHSLLSVVAVVAPALVLAVAPAIAPALAARALSTPQQPLALPHTQTCRQAPVLFPRTHARLDHALNDLYNEHDFQLRAFDALAAIIRVPSESYDDLAPVGQDPRWSSFSDLHAAMESAFPLAYASLNVTNVNTYALVFHWQGTDPSLKPILITAHQDVVPVEPSTIDQWLHPPYSGHYDGKWIWGRGTCDDKSDIASQLIVVETLLKNSFTPARTVVFAFGIDEESAGTQGAGYLADYLEANYGRDGFASLLDEGYGYEAILGGGLLFAGPATGEKGYLDVRITVNTPGGHSSVPPRHTGIGILAAAIVEIEAHPHPTSLKRNGTAFQELQCVAKYGPGIPDAVRKLAERALEDDDALEELGRVFLARSPEFAATLGTTQAVDIVKGGVKVNALPEQVEAVVNHRIAEDSSVAELQDRVTSVLLPVAKKFNLTLNAFGTVAHVGQPGTGELVLADAWGNHIEPAPMTPTVDSKPYDLLSGTIRAALQDSPGYAESELVVVPGLAVGNTDTKSYWNLTRHIYRYSHADGAGMYNGAHTVNEAISGESLINKLRFHTKWILNWDESDL